MQNSNWYWIFYCSRNSWSNGDFKHKHKTSMRTTSLCVGFDGIRIWREMANVELKIYFLTVLSVVIAMIVSLLAVCGAISLKAYMLIGVADIAVMAITYILACKGEKDE